MLMRQQNICLAVIIADSPSLITQKHDLDSAENCTIHSPILCADGKGCVNRLTEYCDGVKQCSDGSDETPYDPEVHDRLDGVQCHVVRLNSPGIRKCFLPKEYICDHERDCTLVIKEKALFLYHCRHHKPYWSAFPQSAWEDNRLRVDVGCFCFKHQRRVAISSSSKCGPEEKVTSSTTASSFVRQMDQKACTSLMTRPKVGCSQVAFQCNQGTDECNCEHSFVCDSSPYPKVDKQCVSRVEFCDNVRNCFDKTDERKYSPGVPGYQCAVSKTRVTSLCMLPTRYTCDGIPDCDFGTDECFCNGSNLLPPTSTYVNGHCFRCLDGTMVIPRLQLCDGKFQCKDLSDECLCSPRPAICDQICKIDQNCGESCKVGQFLCKKGNNNAPAKCIERSMVCDASFDCPLEDDEASCNLDFSQLFNCSDGKRYIPKYQQCDPGADLHQPESRFDPSCTLPGEDLEQMQQLSMTAVGVAYKAMIGHVRGEGVETMFIAHDCLSADLPDCPDHSDEKNCSNIFFECNEESVYNSTVRQGAFEHGRPRYTQKCDLLPTCEDLEDECNATLCGEPLPEYCQFVKGTTGFICPNTLSALIGSQICDGFPSCSEKAPETSADELYCSHRFYCEDRGAKSLPIHIANSSRCNGISDCYDESDEINCSLITHFYCNSGLPRYVPRSKVCNGIQDCYDGEDECQNCSDSPFSSDSFLINSYVLQVFIWIIGLFAVLGNIAVLFHNSWQLWRRRNSMSKMAYNHRMLVTSLGLADLLLGIYLVSLGIVNSLYKGIYCRRDIQWRSSGACLAMGSIAVISTECSVFLLLTMATMRLSLVARPFKAAVKRRYIMCAIILSWVLAFALAIVPLTEYQYDYFLSEVWYHSNPFLTLANRQKVEKLMTSLWSLEDKNSTIFSMIPERSVNWENMIETVSRLNKSFVPSLYFGYYSAHGVCLPRIFPDPSADRSWGFSFFVVTLNFIAFVYMLAAYVAIYRITTVRSRDAGRTDNDVASSLLQHKISRIIFTNFSCWIPICIMAFISTGGGKISQEAYAISAIILLPINSAFNPLLYSDLPDLIWKNILAKTKCGKWIKAERFQRRHKSALSYSNKSTKSTRLGTIQSLTPTNSLGLHMETKI